MRARKKGQIHLNYPFIGDIPFVRPCTVDDNYLSVRITRKKKKKKKKRKLETIPALEKEQHGIYYDDSFISFASLG